MKILCVAEKPSISKAVAKTLSADNTRTRKTKAKYIMNYDFKFNFPGYGLCDVTMTSVLGHITNVDFPPSFSWGKCPPGRLLEAPVLEIVSQKDVYGNIAQEARNANILMIWTDCDREGEFIGWEILQAARSTNTNLTADNVWRSQFSHLERTHVLQAAKNPVKLDVNAVKAVSCRMELDLRVGASFTRLLTDLFRKSTVVQLDKGSNLISYGTCQFPTLGFIVDRYNRVKNFVSEPFWFLCVDVKRDNQTVQFTWTEGHFFDRLYVLLLYQNCLKSDQGQVTNVIRKPTSNWRPLPLTTVELQKDCARIFKMSSKDALDAAEKLYNKGFLSYPRTETDQFPATMDLKELVQKQTQDSRWGQYSQSLLDGQFKQPRGGNRDDKAHPPIHPVNYVNTSSLDNDKQKKVYEYVVRRFLACCSEDAKGEQTTVTLQWGDENFTANGLTVIARNYLDIYPYRKWESSKQLPKFDQGEVIKINGGRMKDGKTSPPSHMTEPELIALMDVNGIGTDATIAEHIHKIITRGYVVKIKQRGSEFIIPSELGMGLIEGFDRIEFENISLSKPFLRKRLENSLQDIVDGRTTKEVVLSEVIQLYRQAFVQSAQNGTTLIQACKEIIEANKS
ncbi:DNA topoisomerase 3 [[Candida] anglica]|uniref:DNA topoisomerase n=1 Tax=[Candida] anglica TaxID=148631 RepID=A0ABP0EBE0_9ASCO